MFDDPIDKTDNQKLLKLEKTIEEGLRIFADVGSALLQIRDWKLYRANFKTFEEYCQEKWGMERAHAYRLIDSAKVVENLKLSPLGDKMEPPTTEAQARPLALLAPEQQVEAWQEANEGAPKGKAPTASMVQRIVDRFRKSKPKKQPREAKSWTTEDLRADGELMNAFKLIDTIYGHDDTKAIRTGLIGLKRSDVLQLSKLPSEKMRECQDLIMANHWTPAKALKFLSKMPDDDTTIEELKNYCLATKGNFFTGEFCGFTITCKANRPIPRDR